MTLQHKDFHRGMLTVGKWRAVSKGVYSRWYEKPSAAKSDLRQKIWAKAQAQGQEVTA